MLKRKRSCSVFSLAFYATAFQYADCRIKWRYMYHKLGRNADLRHFKYQFHRNWHPNPVDNKPAFAADLIGKHVGVS